MSDTVDVTSTYPISIPLDEYNENVTVYLTSSWQAFLPGYEYWDVNRTASGGTDYTGYGYFSDGEFDSSSGRMYLFNQATSGDESTPYYEPTVSILNPDTFSIDGYLSLQIYLMDESSNPSMTILYSSLVHKMDSNGDLTPLTEDTEVAPNCWTLPMLSFCC
jgi:hypothetical protein